MTIKRAIILIGLQHARELPELKAAWDGVYHLKDWALAQGFDPSLVQVITDQNRKDRDDKLERETNDVSVGYVRNAVKKFAHRGDLDQLIIYYSGHGMNISQNEYWLLTDALNDGAEAANLTGSMEAATYGQVPHVVFISDACRTAASTIPHQDIVPGTLIYPKKFHRGPGKDVDVFYATLLGDPSMELQDPDAAASGYSAIYTETLLEALHGLHPEVLKKDGDSGPSFVRPHPLKKFLQKELPLRVLQRLGPTDERSQQPDARITSGEEAWLSCIGLVGISPTFRPRSDHPAAPVSSMTLAHAAAAEFFSELPSIAASGTVMGDTTRLNQLQAESTRMRSQLRGAGASRITQSADRFSREVARNAESFGPAHFETGSGFKMRGATVKKVVAHIPHEILGDGSLVRTNLVGQPAASVLLELTDGRGVLVPAISEFMGVLTFDEEGLADLAFEPMDTSDRWGEFKSNADQIRRLRAVAAAASRLGTFRLEGDNAEGMARQMQRQKGVDPSLALYAAHAYRDQGNRERLQTMAEYLLDDLHLCLFDIALLAGLSGAEGDDRFTSSTFPFLPMLSQTWALLPVYDVELPRPLSRITRHLVPNSLWSVFDPEGVSLISSVLQEGQVQ